MIGQPSTAAGDLTRNTLVVGVGTSDRGDDAAGLLAADAVAALGLPGVAVHRLDGSPLRLLSLWRADDAVILVDAVRDITAAGTIRRVDVRSARTATWHCAGGAHDASLAQTIGLARALGRLPRSLTLYGVAGRRFGLGERPSPEVLVAVDRVADLVRGEVLRPGPTETVTDPSTIATTGPCRARRAEPRS